jgi:DNA topoisomerase I
MKIQIALSKENENWFEELTKEEQDKYVTEHPNSKYAKSRRAARPEHETQVVDGKRVMADGSPLPEHIQKLGIPPGWSDVRINPDPNADLLVTGRDAKGRLQPIYSDAFMKTQAEAKFLRVQALAEEFDAIHEQNEKARRSKTPRKKDCADCMMLIMKTGLRPGSDADTGAEKKAYGASNLKGEHVVIEDGKVFLRFTGKKGVDLNIEVDDKDAINMLKRRAKEAGPDGKLFPNLNEKKLLDYTHTLDGGHFKTKDFRTHLGTATALDEVRKSEKKPANEKEYRKMVLAVAKKVAAKLGNTPTIALQSYISPAVFAEWRMP